MTVETAQDVYDLVWAVRRRVGSQTGTNPTNISIIAIKVMPPTNNS